MERKLAGRIIVLPNKNTTGQHAVKNIKELKFVFVQLRTNLTGSAVSGIFTDSEKVTLYNSLYQSLIVPKDENYSNSVGINEFDLTTDPDFIAGGKYDQAGKYNEDYRSTPTDKIPHFFRDIRRKFIAIPGNSKYNNYFTVFVLQDEVYDNAAGQIEDVGVKNLILYKMRNNLTLSHEALHGLGLYHTHSNGVITEYNQKFTFVYARTNPLLATDNVMSYNGALRKTTWKWQWGIIKKKV
ncbi:MULTISPECIES: hypothetical protein [Flavobacterium]|uniref:hypothetical protein n=1 Tax=Flavobacterium TaxID=237 RepID=UPI000745B1AF|nr:MULTISPECIES: hypothetical protein [Flavobacterium]AMA49708.1 hypothetical protein AWN65_09680 [Flavobacterium covae]MCJ1809544.1 hypothetical protein [Flavobacterium covae]POR17422.1 hypothetical protein BWK58_15035 [Flavobacterium columnare]QYS87733.1 hypothetical protein JJC03_08280 [Flavobacterium oreochromis]